MKQRDLVSILLVLVGIVIGALIMYVVAFNKDTSVQKNYTKIQSSDVKNTESTASEYRNTQYGFEFRYPQDWHIEEHSNYFSLVPREQKNCGPNTDPTMEELICLDHISFSIFQNEDKFTIQKFFDKNEWVKGQDFDDLKETRRGNKIFYEITMISAYDGSRNRSVWIPLDDGSFYTIEESFLLEEEKNVFDQVVRTLHFQ